jgi:hypothetical protein
LGHWFRTKAFGTHVCRAVSFLLADFEIQKVAESRVDSMIQAASDPIEVH